MNENLAKLLEEKIERNAEKHWMEVGTGGDCASADYKAGANLLLPHILELVVELERIANPFQGIPNERNFEDWKSEAVAMKIFANKALADLTAWAKEKA